MGKMKPMELDRHRKKFLPPQIEISADIYEEEERQMQHLKNIQGKDTHV